MVEYLCELRESVLEAYTGIIQGLKGAGGEVSSNLNKTIYTNFFLNTHHQYKLVRYKTDDIQLPAPSMVYDK